MEEEIFSFSEVNDRLSVQSAGIDFSHKRSFSYFLSKQHIFLITVKMIRIVIKNHHNFDDDEADSLSRFIA